jgi:FdhD protein
VSEQRTATVGVTRIRGVSTAHEDDVVAVEEPLEIRVAWHAEGELREKNISVTMRTPGDDFDLAAGFLFTEGLLRSANDIDSLRHWGSPNVVRVAMKSGVHLDTASLDRHFYTTSSCGICGKTSIEALRVVTSTLGTPRPVDGELIYRLPEILNEQQPTFRATGSIHGAALFSREGEVRVIREDIGRHNAVDKVVGAMFREGATPLSDAILMVSSRASFEIAQKAIMAGIPVLASVGGPSSLAVDLAREFGLTLLGFVRDGRYNVYAGEVA